MSNEKRLIDANALLEDFGEEPLVWNDGEAEIQERSDWHRYRVLVKIQPTVEAVEVVRCGECRFVDTDACPMSGTPGRVSASDFCSYGERKDNA